MLRFFLIVHRFIGNRLIKGTALLRAKVLPGNFDDARALAIYENEFFGIEYSEVLHAAYWYKYITQWVMLNHDVSKVVYLGRKLARLSRQLRIGTIEALLIHVVYGMRFAAAMLGLKGVRPLFVLPAGSPLNSRGRE